MPDPLVLTDRQQWQDEDFRTIFASIDALREVISKCPERAAEFAPVLLNDLTFASNALTYIGRGCGYYS